jgi:antibiotic biosynthesis monooxygenase (ABM) superfamily enzyme
MSRINAMKRIFPAAVVAVRTWIIGPVFAHINTVMAIILRKIVILSVFLTFFKMPNLKKKESFSSMWVDMSI